MERIVSALSRATASSSCARAQAIHFGALSDERIRREQMQRIAGTAVRERF